MGLSSLIALTALGVGVAYTASLNATTSDLGTGRAAVPLCNMAGVQSTEVINASKKITGVTVSGLDAACQGDTLTVTVNTGGGTTSSATGAVPAGGGTVTVALGAALAFVDNANIDVVVSGP